MTNAIEVYNQTYNDLKTLSFGEVKTIAETQYGVDVAGQDKEDLIVACAGIEAENYSK